MYVIFFLLTWKKKLHQSYNIIAMTTSVQCAQLLLFSLNLINDMAEQIEDEQQRADLKKKYTAGLIQESFQGNKYLLILMQAFGEAADCDDHVQKQLMENLPALLGCVCGPNALA
jgi:hypothetical protein